MRIVTRPDFDGIVCAVLLSDVLEPTVPIQWVEPNAMQHGLIEIQPNDVIANLAYHENCAMWFDHHESNRRSVTFEGVFKIAPSAAGIIFEYFNNHDDYPNPFKRDYHRLVAETDKIDSAAITLEEVLNSEKNPYVALSSTIYSHNSADEFYWNRLVELLRTQEIEKIVKDEEVNRRIQRSVEADKAYKQYLLQYTSLHRFVSLTDYRSMDKAPSGNRFIVFSLFPESVVNVKVRFENSRKEKVVISIGYSIFNRGCQVSAGEICSHFGGGGHRGAGSCSVPSEEAEQAIATIMDILLKNKPTTFPILYEDHFLIVVDKPPGLLPEGKRILNYEGQLFPLCPLGQNTSGIVVFAKNEKIQKIIQKKIQLQEVSRIYYAIVEGVVPDGENTLSHWDTHDAGEGSIRYNSTQFWKLQSCGKYSLIQLEPAPGDDGVIGKRMALSGLPIVGDKENNPGNDPLGRLLLHAYFLAFSHPVSKYRIVVETQLPQSFKFFCQTLNENIKHPGSHQ